MDFGAVADGETDCTEAFQNALNKAAEEGGGIVSVPRGKFLIASHLVIPESVTLEGIWRVPTSPDPHEEGTCLLAVENKGNADGDPFILLKTNATIKGINVFYPEQVMSLEPHPYPWCIAGDGVSVNIIDCTLVNPYQGVDFGTRFAPRHRILNLYGQPLLKGIYVNRCYDLGRIENVHFWPFWSGPDRSKPAAQFTKQHGTAFIMEKTDGQMLVNCFCILYNVGLRFSPGVVGKFEDGSDQVEPGSAWLTGCYFDESETAVVIDGVQKYSGISFVNCQFMRKVVVMPTNKGEVKFTGCGFWPEGNLPSHAVLEGQGSVLFEACHFSGWDRAREGAACIDANNSQLIVDGCEFNTSRSDHTKVALGPQVRAAVVTSNLMMGGALIEDNTSDSADVQIANNAVDSFAGFVKDWVAIAGFPNPDIDNPEPGTPTRLGFVKDYLEPIGGETTAALTPGTEVAYTEPDGSETILNAQLLSADYQNFINFKEVIDAKNKVGYAFTYLKADEDTMGHFLLGINDGGKVWINGELAYTAWFVRGRGCKAGEFSFDAPLKKGLNPIMVKVEDLGGSKWEFVLEAYDEAGNPIESTSSK